MSIFVDETSRVLVQGMTGAEGTKHTRRMVAAGSTHGFIYNGTNWTTLDVPGANCTWASGISGSNIVGGVTPGKAGQTMDGIPVFGSVADGVAETGADVCVVFVPPKFAKAAVYETIDAGVPLCVIISEGIPVRDSASFWAYSQAKGGTRILGPNCPGVISPGKCNVGITPADITGPGPIGLVSKSGTLTPRPKRSS